MLQYLRDIQQCTASGRCSPLAPASKCILFQINPQLHIIRLGNRANEEGAQSPLQCIHTKEVISMLHLIKQIVLGSIHPCIVFPKRVHQIIHFLKSSDCRCHLNRFDPLCIEGPHDRFVALQSLGQSSHPPSNRQMKSFYYLNFLS